jgi:hypothetical protein
MGEISKPISSDPETNEGQSHTVPGAAEGSIAAVPADEKEQDGASVELGIDGRSPDGDASIQETAAGMFAELVRVHYDWERHPSESGARERYQRTLKNFATQEGEITHVYWSTKRASAVALTVKSRGRIARWLFDDDAEIRLHRVTDWLAPEYRIAELLHHCDTLAIKVSQVLRGTTERIAMQWIYAVQSHLLGYLERTDEPATKRELDAIVKSQAGELIQIERYYAQAGEKASRIVYFWGMMIGALLSGLLGLGLAAILRSEGWFGQPHTLETQTFFVCFAAGGLGAIVSVLMRMSSNRFRVDYEVGRATVRRLGSFRPFIGAVFGMALYFLFQSELLHTNVPPDPGTSFFFFGILAFLAGFNERWTNVLFGKAEKTIAASLGGTALSLPDEEERD